ncbi:MAG: alpha/beta fold hydrolase [Streptococcus mutans]
MAALNKEMVNTLLGPIYTCHREGNPCFVFLSGAGFFSTADNFANIIDKLPDSIGILTIDAPNSGYSPVSNQANVGLRDWVNAILMIFEHFKFQSYLLCVHSIGGFAALQIMNQSSKACLGFIGLEPTTAMIYRAGFSSDLYPQLALRRQKLKTAADRLNYLKDLSRSHFSSQQFKQLWRGYDYCQRQLNDVQSLPDFKIRLALGEEDFKTVISEKVPSIVFSESFREKEYLESEYLNKHTQTKLILCGQHHYLHWSETNSILEKAEQLLSNDEKL